MKLNADGDRQLRLVRLQLAFLEALDRLGRAFGKSTGWSVVFLVLLNVIGMLILGFSSDQYRNPAPLSQPTYR